MAQSIDGYALDTSHVSERAYPGLWKLRLALGWTSLFANLVGLFAVSWDAQWHTAVGRDRTLTAPHLFILGSALVMGLAAVAAVLIETAWARRNPPVATYGTRFAGFFSSSLGAYLIGFGALDAAVSFPLDQYWHTLYGVDLTFWAPFHIMLAVGFCVSTLGAAYMLAEGTHLATQQGAKGAAWVGYAGMILAFATLMGWFTYLVMPALSTGYVSLANLTVTVYPLMLGAFGTFVLMMARRVLPGLPAATSVAVVYLFFGLVNYLIVPPLMTLNLRLEQQNMLPGAPTVSLAAMQWQYSLILAAVLLDLAVWLAQRKGGTVRKSNRMMLSAVLIGLSLAVLFSPSFLTSAQRYSNPLAAGATAVGSMVGQARTDLRPTNVVVIVGVSLLLGLLGIVVGNWFSAGIGESMRRKER